MMNPEVKTMLVAALRSGEYTQTTRVLHRPAWAPTHDDAGYAGGFCCLGVLCDLHMKHAASPEAKWGPANHYGETYYLGTSTYLAGPVQEWAGMEGACGDLVTIGTSYMPLSEHNDNGCTFAEIADAIEAQL